jgi:hypothetical protein
MQLCKIKQKQGKGASASASSCKLEELFDITSSSKQCPEKVMLQLCTMIQNINTSITPANYAEKLFTPDSST